MKETKLSAIKRGLCEVCNLQQCALGEYKFPIGAKSMNLFPMSVAKEAEPKKTEEDSFLPNFNTAPIDCHRILFKAEKTDRLKKATRAALYRGHSPRYSNATRDTPEMWFEGVEVGAESSEILRLNFVAADHFLRQTGVFAPPLEHHRSQPSHLPRLP
jgi:hypothetical protein